MVWSLKSEGAGVAFRTIKLWVNDTQISVSTDSEGQFTKSLNLEPINDKSATYQIQAVFEGDTPSSATAYAITMNGTRYPVSTTIKYGYKPASNGTWLKGSAPRHQHHTADTQTFKEVIITVSKRKLITSETHSRSPPQQTKKKTYRTVSRVQLQLSKLPATATTFWMISTLALVDNTRNDWASTPTQPAAHNIEVVVHQTSGTDYYF